MDFLVGKISGIQEIVGCLTVENTALPAVFPRRIECACEGDMCDIRVTVSLSGCNRHSKLGTVLKCSDFLICQGHCYSLLSGYVTAAKNIRKVYGISALFHDNIVHCYRFADAVLRERSTRCFQGNNTGTRIDVFDLEENTCV